MISETLYDKYLSALLAGNRKVCIDIVETLIENKVSIKTIYEDLFQKSMYQVGELWETNKISVSVEHLATAITESLLNIVYPHMFSEEKSTKKAVVTCTPGEYHQIGARMVADYFELNSWNSYFLGANTPTKELLKYISETKPDIIVISISIAFSIHTLVDLVDELTNNFPSTKIILGGQAFRWGGKEMFNKYPNVEIITTLSQLEDKYLSKTNYEAR